MATFLLALLTLTAYSGIWASTPANRAPTTAVCATAPANLVAWWAGENNALDSYVAHPGNPLRGVGYAPGMVGQAFSFDGVDDAVAVGMLGDVGVAEGTPFSIAAWINARDPSVAGLHLIAGNYMGEGGGTGNFSTYFLVSAGQLSFAINERQIEGIAVNTAITSGWNFVVATYDGTTLSLYVNGQFRDAVARNFAGSADNTRGWTLGNFSDETNAAHGFNSTFDGLIDELTIFDRALSLSEIAAIHAAGNLGVCRPEIFADSFE